MQDIYDILAKHFAGETSAEEERFVADWKQTNREEYDLFAVAFNMVPEAVEKDFAFKQYDHIAALKKMEPLLNKPDGETTVFRLNSFFKYAAAACAVLLIGITAVWLVNGNGFTTVTNDGLSAKEISLPDGSTVWLAANSSMDYFTDFTDNRNIQLKGEAFFEVEPDKSHPFKVETATGEIEVLGTAFNVEVTEGETEVSVDHGLVALRNENGEVKLSKGQRATSDGKKLSEIVAADENYLSWRTGIFHFEDTPLDEVVAELNKFYPEKITVDRKISPEHSITGEFDNRPVEELIEVIVLTCGLEAEYGEGTIRLK